MRLLFVSAFASALLVWAGCGTFPTTYDRVDPDMVRTLDFIYEPAEAAPGDSVTVTAVFAGKPLDPQRDIDWRVSWNVVTNAYGIDTALDEQPLEMQLLPSDFSPNTYSMRFRFKVPESTIAASVMIPENPLNALPATARAQLPPGAENLSKSLLLALIDSAAARVPSWSTALAQGDAERVHDSLMLHDSVYVAYKQGLEPLLPLLLQMMTARARVFADLQVDDRHRIRSTYTVRYHSRFAAMPEAKVYPNRNPRIDSIVVYTVEKENLQHFDPQTSAERFTAMRIDSCPPDSVPVLLVDAGKSYFVAGFTDNIDRSLSMDSALCGGGPLEEQHHAQWYFQVEGGDIDKVDRYDYMNIVSLESLVSAIYPSKDRRLTSTTIWLEVRDHMINELFRPVGSTLAEVRLNFSYTDAWLNAAQE